MRTKVIETKLVPAGDITAITLFGLVFTRDRKQITPRILNHELIHCQQQLELLYIPFFIVCLGMAGAFSQIPQVVEGLPVHLIRKGGILQRCESRLSRP